MTLFLPVTAEGACQYFCREGADWAHCYQDLSEFPTGTMASCDEVTYCYKWSDGSIAWCEYYCEGNYCYDV